MLSRSVSTHLRELPLVLLHKRGIDGNLRGRKGGRSNELERRVAVNGVSRPPSTARQQLKYLPNELPRKPEEGLLEVVVRLRRDFEVLDVLLAVESDLAGLDFPLLHTVALSMNGRWRGDHLGRLPASTYLHIDLVTAENDGDVLADTLQITVPVGDVLVRDAGGHVEHDDTTLALDVVSITETTKLFLPSGIPDVEADGAEVGRERERVHFHTKSG